MYKKTLAITWVLIASFSSFEVHAAQKQDLLLLAKSVREHFSSRDFDHSKAPERLKEFLENAYKVSVTDFDTDKAKLQAKEIVQEFWATRLALREQLADAEKRGLASDEYIAAVRNFMRATRYLEHLVGEAAGPWELPKGAKAEKLFSEGPMNLLINPKFGKVEFKSGDMLLVRGNRFNSAAIARIGDVDTQFSHIAQIYIGEGASEPTVVESLIEVGLVTTPLSTVLDEGMGHVILLRHPDEKLAKDAAKALFDRATKAPHTDYDFTMELNGSYKNLYCSRAIRYGFDVASQGQTMIPSHPSTISAKNRDLLERIGVTARTTFAPGDVEFDTRLDIVAEWRDYRVTRDIRLKDMILTKYFEWMERDGLKFKESTLVSLGSRMGWRARHLPVLGEIVQDVANVPPGMSRRGLATVIMIQFTSEPVLEHIEKVEREHRVKTGLPMHPRDILAALESFRADGGLCDTYLDDSRNPKCIQLAREKKEAERRLEEERSNYR